MAINKGTIKQKTSNGTEILYPITSVDQIQDLSTAVVDLTSNQEIDGVKTFVNTPLVYKEGEPQGKNLYNPEYSEQTYWMGSYVGPAIYVGPNEYATLSYKTPLSDGLGFYFVVSGNSSQATGSNGTWMYHSQASYLDKTVATIQADSQGYIYLKNAGSYQALCTNILDNEFQIELGQTKTDYEPYISPTEALARISDIPTDNAQLTNGAGYITDNYHDDTKEDIANKVITLSASSTNTYYPSAKCVYDNIEDVREVALGKTSSFVCNLAYNPALNSQLNIVTVNGNLIKTDGMVIPINDTKIGDIVYITDTDIPDRWISNYLYGSNLFDIERSRIASVGTLQSDGGYYISSANSLGIWTAANCVTFNGESGKQYKMCGYIKSSSIDTFINIALGFRYSDGTISQCGTRGSYTDYTYVEGLSTTGKTVVSIGVYYASAENIFVKDIDIRDTDTTTKSGIVLTKMETVKPAVVDVQVNGTSAITNQVANITVPTNLSDLTDDATHRVVTDTQTAAWDGMLPKTGGTMTGNIYLSRGGDSGSSYNDVKITYRNGSGQARDLIGGNYNNIVVGNYQTGTEVSFYTGTYVSGGSQRINIKHYDGQNSYIMLDTRNTSGNPGATAANARLTSLKLNDTTYKLDYATFSDLPTNADYVDLTTAQVINGQKDFNLVPRVKIEHDTHDLPDTYQEVEYIEGNGSQYIDTNIKANSAYTYKFTVKRTTPYNYNIWGTKLNSSYSAAPCIILGWAGNSYIAVYSHGGTSNGAVPQVVDWGTEFHNIVFNPTSSLLYIDAIDRWAEFTSNGTTSLTNASWSTDTYNIYLGGTNTAGSFVGGGPASWGTYEVWNGETLLQQLVPCYRKSDSVVGMYDTVNNAFYTNQGTGNFTVGADIYPVTYETMLTDASVPSKTSQLTNDSGFITSSYHDSTKANQSSLNAVTAKIPTEASSSNQLADKAFVNSSIATATSTFRGTYTTLQDLQAVSGDLNDYAFYNHTDAAGNTLYDRYKYTTNTPHWEFEYTLNNSSFTSDQWSALNSGVSSGTWVNTSTAQVIDGQKDFSTTPRVKVTHQTHNLPSEYQEVEYIGSNGNQYINTGFVPSNNNYGFDIDLLVVDTPNTANGYIGYRSVSVAAIAGDMRYCFIYGDRRLAIRNGVSADNSTSTIVLNQKYNFNYNSGSLKINSVEQVNCTQYSANPTFKTFYLFKANTDGYYSADLGTFVGQIYEAKLYDNGTLERDFIPCYRKADDKPGMYDLITETFFTNAGTGEFGVGPDVELITYENVLTDANFATVAFSGSYNDLAGKPTIPTVNNATLTIQKNGTTVNTFTANASSNVTANITIPTKTSDLTNDSGFIINPITTTGDIIIGGSNGSPIRLGIGTYGKILTSNGTSSVWQKPKTLYRHHLTILSDVHPTGYLSEMNMNIITIDDQLTYVNNPSQLLSDINNYICYYSSMVDGDVGICVPHIMQDENGNIGMAISYMTYDWINNTTGATTEKIVFYFNTTDTFATIEEIVIPYGKNHIGFNVPDGEYSKTFWCAEGQTWEDWIYSGNNIDNYSISENYILNSNGQQVIYNSYDGGQPVLKTDEIESGYYYKFSES